MPRCLPLIEVLVACIGNMVNVVVATHKEVRQQNEYDFGCKILYNPMALLWH